MKGSPSFETIVGLIDDSGDFAGLDGVRLALHQPVEVRHPGLHREVVHLVVEQDAGSLGHLAGAERAVQRVGDGDGVAVLVDDRIVRRLRRLAEALGRQVRRDAGAVRIDLGPDLLGIGVAGQLRDRVLHEVRVAERGVAVDIGVPHRLDHQPRRLRRAVAEVGDRIALEDVQDLADDQPARRRRRRRDDVVAAIVALHRLELAHLVLPRSPPSRGCRRSPRSP